MDQGPPAGWTQRENSLTRTIQRQDFVEALAFLIAVGKISETADHHPDVDLRYNKLHFSLCTHSAGHSLTEKDFALAEKINGVTDDATHSIACDLRARFAH